MNDTQILTLCVTLLGIFAASWFNNSRIGEMTDVLRAEMKATHAEMNLQFEHTNNKLDAVLKLRAY